LATGRINRLHQDLYGDLAFPLQVVVLLIASGRGFLRLSSRVIPAPSRARAEGWREMNPRRPSPDARNYFP
jgi:hypothetical protein